MRAEFGWRASPQACFAHGLCLPSAGLGQCVSEGIEIAGTGAEIAGAGASSAGAGAAGAGAGAAGADIAGPGAGVAACPDALCGGSSPVAGVAGPGSLCGDSGSGLLPSGVAAPVGGAPLVGGLVGPVGLVGLAGSVGWEVLVGGVVFGPVGPTRIGYGSVATGSGQSSSGVGTAVHPRSASLGWAVLHGGAHCPFDSAGTPS